MMLHVMFITINRQTFQLTFHLHSIKTFIKRSQVAFCCGAFGFEVFEHDVYLVASAIHFSASLQVDG